VRRLRQDGSPLAGRMAAPTTRTNIPNQISGNWALS
jgi:hypothetical protein